MQELSYLLSVWHFFKEYHIFINCIKFRDGDVENVAGLRRCVCFHALLVPTVGPQIFCDHAAVADSNDLGFQKFYPFVIK